jgi:hypothetical protein
MSRAPDFNQHVQLATSNEASTPNDAVPKPKIYSKPSQHLYPESPIGKRIYIRNGSNESQRLRMATVGGLVEFEDKCYYLTAGHVFRNQIDPFMPKHGDGVNAEFDFDDGSADEEGYNTDDDVDGTSRGSITPEYATSESDISDDDSFSVTPSITSLPESFTIFGSELPALDTTSTHSQSYVDIRDPPIESLAVTGDLVMTSFDTSDDSLDYALVEVTDPSFCHNKFRVPGRTPKRYLEPQMVAQPSGMDTNIIAATGSNEPTTGCMSGTPSFMHFPGGTSCQEIYTIHLDGCLC